MLGERDQQLVWGRPTRQGPTDLQTLALNRVQSIELYGGDRPIPEDANLPRGCTICLRLTLSPKTESLDTSPPDWCDIPFTDLELAQQWRDHLLKPESADSKTDNPKT